MGFGVVEYRSLELVGIGYLTMARSSAGYLTVVFNPQKKNTTVGIRQANDVLIDFPVTEGAATI